MLVERFSHCLPNCFTGRKGVVIKLPLGVIANGLACLEDLQDDQQGTDKHHDEGNDHEEDTLDVGVVVDVELPVESLSLVDEASGGTVLITKDLVTVEKMPVGETEEQHAQRDQPFRSFDRAVTFRT